MTRSLGVYIITMVQVELQTNSQTETRASVSPSTA